MNIETNITASLANPQKQAVDLVRNEIDAIDVTRHLVFAAYMSASDIAEYDQRNALSTLLDMVERRIKASSEALTEALTILQEELA